MKRGLIFSAFVLLAVSSCAQQQSSEESGIAGCQQGMNMSGHQHAGMNMSGHQHAGMTMPMTGSQPSPMMLFASGTAWEPAQTPEAGWHWVRGGWQLMVHGNLFVTFDHEGGPRGVGKLESMNFAMLMQQHRLGHGTILFRQMLSAEPLTAPHGGFPELFQTGETYHGAPLVDRQHPHDVFAEISVTYLLPIHGDRVQWLFYGGPAGEPALGPVAYIHRASAMNLPQAPLSHHLQDSTHISYGVVTSGFIFGVTQHSQLKLEASAFNGREPDERRYNFDFAPLDSWSVRASARIGERWAAQYSIGHLVHPEAIEPGNLTRQTASVQYSRVSGSHEWLNTIVWGRNRKQFATSPQNSYLLESLLRHKRNAAFTRMELVDKDELFPPEQTYPPTESAATAGLIGREFRIGAYTFGASHSLVQRDRLDVALGADFTVYSKPATLDAFYGRDPVGFQIFLRFRPGAMQMH
ncbi:MAG TPA: hypothetical protein VKB56_00710 [Terriglobales bacterium]|nr:hypothetical protein [Terriglobales bacterium]